MKLIVCLDDKNGMLFNKRRQSSDRALCQKIVAMTHGSVLWMHPYSEPLFAGLGCEVQVHESFLEQAESEAYCFAENIDVTPYLTQAQQIVIFRWNRTYPADLRFPGIPEELQMITSEDFPGSSHEKITMEVYER